MENFKNVDKFAKVCANVQNKIIGSDGNIFNSIRELAKKIQLFMDSPIERDFKRIVLRYYDWDVIADRTMKLYQILIK